MEEQANEVQGQNSSKAWIGIVAVIVIIAIVGIGYKYSTQQKPQTLGASDKQSPIMAAEPTEPASPYKDGTYTAEGDYTTHVGQKHISVKITLKNGEITDADVTNQADDKMSEKYQDSFISGYKAQVVGKKIDTVKLSKVAQSSLTPSGFNNALQTIGKQAKAQS
ncbi:MAG: FMN-binding protein [Candidatus Levyibacteriota bacterium]